MAGRAIQRSISSGSSIGFGCHSNNKNGNEFDADEDRRSVSYFGLHLVAPSLTDLQGQQQTDLQLAECFVLLPREGIVNVPYSPARTSAAVEQIHSQLELQTGYTAASSRLLLRGQVLTESDLPTEATLQLTVRPAFRQLADSVEDGGDHRSIAAWLTAVARERRTSRQVATARRQRRQQRGLSGTNDALDDEAEEDEVDPKSVAHSAFVLACCRNGCMGLVRLFLQMIPSLAVAATHRTGRTGLHFACYHEQPRLCRLLLSRMPRDAAALRDAAGQRAADYAAAASGSSEAAATCRRLVLSETARRSAGGLSANPAAAAAPGAESMRLFRLPLPGREAEPQLLHRSRKTSHGAGVS